MERIVRGLVKFLVAFIVVMMVLSFIFGKGNAFHGLHHVVSFVLGLFHPLLRHHGVKVH